MSMEHGQHLLVQAISQRLLEPQEILQFLVHCARHIGLSIIGGPEVRKTDAGLAGYVLIAESHISVHTDGLAIWLDVFSCRRFNTSSVLELAIELLLLETTPKPKTMILNRGWGRDS